MSSDEVTARFLRSFVESHPFAKGSKGWGTRQFYKDASQTRDYCIAKNAMHRAARPDPSFRKERSLRMTSNYARSFAAQRTRAQDDNSEYDAVNGLLSASVYGFC